MAFQDSFLSLAVSSKKITRNEKFLKEMEKVTPWVEFISILTPYYEANGVTGKDSPTGGRPRKELLLILKMYFLSQWFGLGDEATEDAVYERLSFQKFLDINLVSTPVPDATTLENFRHLLEKENLTEKLFQKTRILLENQ